MLPGPGSTAGTGGRWRWRATASDTTPISSRVKKKKKRLIVKRKRENENFDRFLTTFDGFIATPCYRARLSVHLHRTLIGACDLNKMPGSPHQASTPGSPGATSTSTWTFIFASLTCFSPLCPRRRHAPCDMRCLAPMRIWCLLALVTRHYGRFKMIIPSSGPRQMSHTWWSTQRIGCHGRIHRPLSTPKTPPVSGWGQFLSSDRHLQHTAICPLCSVPAVFFSGRARGGDC